MAERIEILVRGQRELLANVSHELKTPLTSLKLQVQGLLMMPPASLSADDAARFQQTLDVVDRVDDLDARAAATLIGLQQRGPRKRVGNSAERGNVVERD